MTDIDLTCRCCIGKGFIELNLLALKKLLGEKPSPTLTKITCYQCGGFGKVTWVDEIIGRNTPFLKIVIRKENKNE